MKKIITKGIMMMFLVMAAALAAPEGMAGNGMETVEAANKSISLNKKKVTIVKGKKYTLKVKNTKKKVSWSSNKKQVASVNKKGVVTAKKAGTAVITAKVSGKKLKCKVTVLALNKSKASVIAGKTCQLKVSGSKEKVSWSSSNKQVASVNKKGVVTAKKAGTATITAKVSGKSLKCSITVKEDSSRYKLSASSLTLYPGESKAVSVKNTSMKVSWGSSDKNIVTVDITGMVKAVRRGSAVITAKVNGRTLKCNVAVKEDSSKYELSASSLTLYPGESKKVSVKNTGMDIIWSSSDKNVATVDEAGLVTAVQEGNAVITAEVNGKSLSAEIKVVRPELNTTQAELSDENSTIVLSVKNAKEMVSWNTEELSENFYYEITGKQGETLTLTKKDGAFGENCATADTGKYSMSCDIKSYTVQEMELTCFEPTESDVLIYENGVAASFFELYNTFENNKIAYRHYENLKKMTLVSTDEAVVKVLEGVEYVYKRGTATLTGATEDGYASYIFHVTVEGSYLKTYGEYNEQVTEELFERLKQEETQNTNVNDKHGDYMPEEEWEHLLGIAEKWYQGEITYREMEYQMRWTKPEGIDIYQNYVVDPETGLLDETVSGYYIFNAWEVYNAEGILNAEQIEEYLNTYANYTADPNNWRIAVNLLFIRVHYDLENNRTFVYMVL